MLFLKPINYIVWTKTTKSQKERDSESLKKAIQVENNIPMSK